ncbi:MAG TPA: MBOAT family protein [bacterium]|nr:MBOAT family protein [bacterium]
MLFNSYPFIFLFLPIALIGYFFLNWKRLVTAGKAWLALSSVVFYAYWNWRFVALLAASICFNYAVGATLLRLPPGARRRKAILAAGVVVNLLVLGYYKYANFFIANFNSFLSAHVGALRLILPLGISFFTFTQIAFLVDSSKGKANEYSFLNYILFVTFFPHLIAGPIIHHREMMPQFDRLRNKLLNWKNLSQGAYQFSIGLAKKVIVADAFAVWADKGFAAHAPLNFIEAWTVTLAFTLQLYFDFSGYTDMALGLARMFNIILPRNFNSPYKALNVQDFWKRWHMTLSRFLRDYVYIPLGGNRKGKLRTHLNVLLTFVIGGFWHGAGWTFMLWGFLHGLGNVIHRIWEGANLRLGRALAWVMTFGFVSVCWVFFRARTLPGAVSVLRGMAGLNGVQLPRLLAGHLSLLTRVGVEFTDGCVENVCGRGTGPIMIAPAAGMIGAFLLVCILLKNSDEMTARFSPNARTLILATVLFVVSFLSMNKVSTFLYFNF